MDRFCRPKAARMRDLASQFRAHAGDTGQPAYREKMLKVARELEQQAAKLAGMDHPPPNLRAR